PPQGLLAGDGHVQGQDLVRPDGSPRRVPVDALEGRRAMKFSEGTLPGVYLLELERKPDARGWFARSWCAREFEEHGLSSTIAQVNTQWSPRTGTLRGLHFQEAPHA